MLYCDRISISGKNRCVPSHACYMFCVFVRGTRGAHGLCRGWVSLSPRRCRFSTSIEILCDIVVMEQLSDQILRFAPVIIITPVIHARLYVYYRRYKILATDSVFVLTNWSQWNWVCYGILWPSVLCSVSRGFNFLYSHVLFFIFFSTNSWTSVEKQTN